jgi:hypothetical protein
MEHGVSPSSICSLLLLLAAIASLCIASSDGTVGQYTLLIQQTDPGKRQVIEWTDKDGKVTEVKLKGQIITRGMLFRERISRLGAPDALDHGEQGPIVTYWIDGGYWYFYFSGGNSGTLDFIAVDWGY